MIKKIQNSIAISVLLLALFVINVSALEIETVGSLSFSYQYDKIPLPEVTVSLYQVASRNEDGTYLYKEEFSNQVKEIDKLSSSELRGLSKELITYVKSENINYSFQGKTESNGELKFSELESGIYLVETDELKLDGKVYTASPLLVTIPQKFGENKYDYNVKVEAKTEMIRDENSGNQGGNNGDNNTTTSPSTYDAIILYVGILAICVVGLAVVVYYINKKRKGVKK